MEIPLRKEAGPSEILCVLWVVSQLGNPVSVNCVAEQNTEVLSFELFVMEQIFQCVTFTLSHCAVNAWAQLGCLVCDDIIS